MTITNHAGPASLMKGQLYQSAPGTGDWHVAEDDNERLMTNNNPTGEEEESSNHVVSANNNGATSAAAEEILVNGNTATTGKQLIDFLQDDPKDMTLARRIALSLMDKKWYNPKAGEDDVVEEEEDIAAAAAEKPASNDDMEGTPTATSDGLENGTSANRSSHSGMMQLTKSDDFDTMMHNRKPSLAKAWAYFEHVALYRYLVPQDEPEKQKKNICVRAFRKLFCKGDKKLDRAESGEWVRVCYLVRVISL